MKSEIGWYFGFKCYLKLIDDEDKKKVISNLK